MLPSASMGSFTRCACELDEGDTLVLYTDGLIERRSEHLMVGFDRLVACLLGRARGSGESCAITCSTPWSDDNAGEDDIALLAVTVGLTQPRGPLGDEAREAHLGPATNRGLSTCRRPAMMRTNAMIPSTTKMVQSMDPSFPLTDVCRHSLITLDYRLNAVDGTPWPCRCGAHACTGVVEGGFFSLDPRRQRALVPFAGAFVRKEYQRRTAP